MDDKEYYALMNRTSSAVIMDALRRKKQVGALQEQPEKSYKTLETRQGKADAEMLMEKNDEAF